ncbi:hypothetical protein [Streptomyces sp. Wb2n-11]|uniref:hypothetical protein n=1 Tax=Streptomyces sp. Wb2n-11 TaxID=1030533 RepID=UPI0021006188|nr:hypothetical protein [Streptomyces sp. Wb2n-11]
MCSAISCGASPGLDTHGGVREVSGLVRRLPQHGTGAGRQRAALTAGGLRAVPDLVLDKSTTP